MTIVETPKDVATDERVDTVHKDTTYVIPPIIFVMERADGIEERAQEISQILAVIGRADDI